MAEYFSESHFTCVCYAFFIFHEGVDGRDLILTRLLFFCHMKGMVSSGGEFSRHNLPFEVISVD